MVTEQLDRGQKLNIWTDIIKKSYFKVPKPVRINFTHYFVLKISNKR